MQETAARRGDLTSALGAFDLALEQESLVRADGFWDGASVDTLLVKPIQAMNAKLFAGSRVSNDDFPIYEQELVTNDGGDFNIGVVFSMRRDRAIDARRTKLSNARSNVRAAEIEVDLAKVVTRRWPIGSGSLGAVATTFTATLLNSPAAASRHSKNAPRAAM